jgi:phage head maturation protease
VIAGWGAVSSVVLAIFSISELLEVAISSTAALSSSSIEVTFFYWARCCLTTFETRSKVAGSFIFYSALVLFY